MIMSEGLGTMLAAMVAAIVTVIGYTYQKHQEREFSLTKTRRKIYRKVIENYAQLIFNNPITKALQDPEAAAQPTVALGITVGLTKHPELQNELQKLTAERFENVALL